MPKTFNRPNANSETEKNFKNKKNQSIFYSILAILLVIIIILVLLLVFGKNFSAKKTPVQNSSTPSQTSSGNSTANSTANSSTGKIALKYFKTEKKSTDLATDSQVKIYEGVCGKLINSTSFGSVGEIISGPIAKNCSGIDKEYLQVKFSGSETGFVESKTGAASDLKPLLETGQVSGTISYPSEGVPLHRICGETVITPLNKKSTSICTLNISPSENVKNKDSSPDILPFSMNYQLDLPVGTYYISMEILDPSFNLKKGYFTSCEFAQSGISKTELDKICKGDFKTKVSAVPVTIAAGELVPNISPTNWYQDVVKP